MAPTGEMMSWQTRLQSSAARSGAERVKSSALGEIPASSHLFMAEQPYSRPPTRITPFSKAF
jgi:hypothetical protein